MPVSPAHLAIAALDDSGGAALATLRATRTRSDGDDAISWAAGPSIPAPWTWHPATPRWLELLPEAERPRGGVVLRHRGGVVLRASRSGLDSDAVERDGARWLARAESPWQPQGGYSEVLLTLDRP